MDMLRWITNREQGAWKELTPVTPAPPPPKRVEDLRVTFVNHSTLLIQIAGLNILTDPVWSERVSPMSWVGPKRHKSVGIRFEDLPPIDVILLSHNHYDHLDIDTLERLMHEHPAHIYTSLGVGTYLATQGITAVTETDWWDSLDLGNGIRLHATPAFHFSNRGLFDRNTSLWCGFLLEAPKGNVYFAADTGFGPFFEEIRKRFGPPRLSLLPIGAYRPRWFMSPVHMGPDEAVRVHQILDSRQSIGIHFGTFAQADDGEDEPIDLLNATLDQEGIPRTSFIALPNGGTWG
jgi:L-ascorbate metabolism protein UlaG (beta-lactamase superfamily)